MNENSVFLINFPYIKQSKNSACCGPYSIWMINEWMSWSTGKENISPKSLIKKCNVSKKWGTEVDDMVRVMKELGILFKKIGKFNSKAIKDIKKHINIEFPVLALVDTGCNIWHWCVIKGYTDNAFIFSDSYYGKHTVRYFDELHGRINYIYKITY